jgi:hypothetical protein
VRPRGGRQGDDKTISNRADLVSGGDALVRITGVRKGATVRVGRRPVTKAFTRRGRTLTGLVSGLRSGRNVIRAGSARLVVRNHPIGGPVFAGAQVQPWVCNTEEFGLGPAQDAQCNVDPVVTHEMAGDIPILTETGVIDRGVYRLAMPETGWNGKVLYEFGGGTAPHHTQGGGPNVKLYDALSRGFMVATNGLAVHGANSNDVVNAEALMMLKEHIRERYGPIRFTISTGCSGGGLAQNLIADTYPGLLDGLLTHCSFPDLWSAAPEVHDCILLTRYFNQTSPLMWLDPTQRAQVLGQQSIATCHEWLAAFGTFFDPTAAANCDLPAEEVYSGTNPDGVRCSLNDYMVAVFGRRKKELGWTGAEQRLGRGFANRPVDNVGVQYGLNALEHGFITGTQFVDLNEKIGGLNIDGQVQPERSEAPPGVIARTYRSGMVTYGRALARVPIIDLRGLSQGEVHEEYQSYALRARLLAVNGTLANHALWRSPVPTVGDPTWAFCGAATSDFASSVNPDPPPTSTCTPDGPLLVMDRWLSSVQADKRKVPLAKKVADGRPAAAADKCVVLGEAADDAACDVFPRYGSPRIAAGGPEANNVLKCSLRPLVRSDYSDRLSDAQFARLQAIFPSGVCDWSVPGVGQQPPKATWLSYAKGPGGQALGRAPRSRGQVRAGAGA